MMRSRRTTRLCLWSEARRNISVDTAISESFFRAPPLDRGGLHLGRTLKLPLKRDLGNDDAFANA